VPVPVFVSPPVPVTVPLKVAVPLFPPTVSVLAPSVTLPAPLKPSIVSLEPTLYVAPLATLTSAESSSVPVTDSVPALIVVVPV